MIKAGVLFFGSIYERTGAGKVVRSFNESVDLFQKNGIKLSLFSLDLVSKPRLPKKENKTIKIIKKSIHLLFKQTSIGSFLLIDRLYFGKGAIVVNQHWKEIIEQDALIFHEINTCYAYLKKCEKEKIKLIPYILVLHTNGECFKMDKIYYPKLERSRYMAILEKRADKCMNMAKRVSFVSKMSVETFMKLKPQYCDKAQMVYNGISSLEEENTPKFDGNIRMVTVGTVNARKNQIMLVEAIGKLKNKYNISLVVVGGGDKLEECRKMAIRLGVEGNVFFLGGRDDIPQILEKNNLFVMSSYDEGLPISAIEALRSGLPVILTDVGGNKELIENNGYLIEPKLESLLYAIDRFSESIEKQQEMSEKSRKLFNEKFSTDKMIEGYCKSIKDII